MINPKPEFSILKQKNVLFIDDDKSKLFDMKEILQYFFRDVIVFDDSIDALHYYEKNRDKVDIIITDIRMPKLNGIDFCKKIREIDGNLPLFICSTYTEIEDLLESIKLNLIDYIVKPVSLAKLEKSFSILSNKLENINEMY